ncbi:hypothetical protein [Maricaulis sp.]|uniref:hypothetical protein n=1 Tax=Maricaulis sp. TaxID=1486257 RepID=UPI0026136F85|nr:hypothetical protein [Maricaulis sp.]MDF1768626.1 hypothetical protein [Maricaulis sp.]
MKLSANILACAVTLGNISCSPEPAPIQIEPSYCAVYEAYLSHAVERLNDPELLLAPIIIMNQIGDDVVRFPDWEDWHPVDGDQSPTPDSLSIEALDPLPHAHRISCSFDSVTNWAAIAGESESAGWILATPASPRLSIYTGSHVELHLSPVYVSADGQLAMMSVGWQEIASVDNPTFFHGPASGVEYVRLQRRLEGQWQATGTSPGQIDR